MVAMVDSGGDDVGVRSDREVVIVVRLGTTAGHESTERRRGYDSGAGVADTSEVRWFIAAELPNQVVQWFTAAGTKGRVHHRTDLYRVDGPPDRGVKLRHGETLELKLRTGEPTIVELGPGARGVREEWRRWSPAEERVESAEHGRWVEVSKTVIKRRFRTDGREEPLTVVTQAMAGTGCEVEVAGITTPAGPSWTFAFAAFGDDGARQVSLEVAARAVLGAVPSPLHLEGAVSCGYPEWLTRVCTGGEDSTPVQR